MTHRKLLLPFLVLSLAGCSSAASGLITAAEGGVVRSDAAELTVPAMSLAADTEITVDTASASDYPALENGRPEVVRLQPEGTVLETPATVVVRSDLIDAAPGSRVSIHQLRDIDGVRAWRAVESVFDSETGEAEAYVTTFAPLGIVVEAVAATATVTGTLSWGSGDPADGAPVELRQGETVVATATTDAAGAFTFADVEPGAYTVNVDYECTIDEAITLEAGETEELTLTLCGG